MMSYFHRRLRRPELVGVEVEIASEAMIDRPPAETRDEWLARRQGGLEWVKDQAAADWVLQPRYG